VKKPEPWWKKIPIDENSLKESVYFFHLKTFGKMQALTALRNCTLAISSFRPSFLGAFVVL